jgi:hypothetical protein
MFPTYQVIVTNELKIGIFVVDVLFALAAIFILVQRKSKTELLLDVAVGVGFTLFLLVCIEAAFFFLNRSQDQLEDVALDFIKGGETANVQFRGEHARALFQRDDWLGYKPVPNTQVVASREKAGKVLYNVVYSIDSHGRRVTPVENLGSVSHYILFFGGSYTFGEGVNDNETMPYYVSQLVPKYRSYNYGAGGYGPQHMLAKLQSEEITTEIDEPQGIVIYTFMIEHINRAIGSMGIHSQRGELMPYYLIDTDGRLVRNSNLVSGRPTLSIFYWIASKSQTLRYFGIDFPLRYSDEHLKTTVRIIEESRNTYRDKFNSDEFYVLIYPGLGFPELIPFLEAAGIRYLDYSDIPPIYNDDFWLGEGHPTAKAHRIVAEKLVQDLGIVADTSTHSSTNR